MERRHRASLFGRALLIGALLPAPMLVATYLVGIAPERQASDVWSFLLLVLWVALPFLVLAYQGIQDRRTWASGLAVAVAIWGMLLLTVFGDRTKWDGTESIGAGAALFLFPLLVAVGMMTPRVLAMIWQRKA